MNTQPGSHTDPSTDPTSRQLCCRGCQGQPVQLRPLFDPRLFPQDQVPPENRVPLCQACWKKLRDGKYLVGELQTPEVFPPQLSNQGRFDYWGNPVLPDGRRLKGELFYENDVQRHLRGSSKITLFTEYVKYPRTPHLPWSPSRDRDDEWIEDVSIFESQDVVATLKMDGENTTMYHDHIHARSIDSRHHPSRAWVKRLHARIQHEIPKGWRICGENLYAKHSIHYRNLSSYFMVFSIWNDRNECLNWEETQQWCDLLGLETVPVLYEGPWQKEGIQNLMQEKHRGDPMEGYVVRVADSFHYQAFKQRVAKCVREGHVQTSQHWMHQEVVPNQLASQTGEDAP